MINYKNRELWTYFFNKPKNYYNKYMFEMVNYPEYLLFADEEIKELKGKWNNLFNNDNDIYLEIGSGSGNFTIEMACRNSNINFIGDELRLKRLVYSAKKSQKRDLKNIKFIRFDATKIDEFLDRDLHATSYSSRLALQVFKSLISPDERDIKDENALYIYHRNVVAFNGSMTSQLRSFYGLNRFTHSFESEDLRIGKNYRIDEIKYTKDELILVAKNEKRGLEISENRRIYR